MPSPELDIDALIAARVRGLRTELHLTLDGLAHRSGISRSMLSRVERGESSPTAGLLMKLCEGLGVSLAALLGGEPSQLEPSLARRADQPVWREPASGYLRRSVWPAGPGTGVDIAEVEMPVGAAVVVDPPGPAAGERHVWVLDGVLTVAGRDGVVALGRGDCFRLAPSGPVLFRNAGGEVARYAVVTSRTGDGA